ncbi:MAG: hypothetical protein ABII01_00595 [Candidatus Woesearchaeota archaeon]
MVNIIEEKDSFLLNRKELIIEIDFEVVPWSKKDAVKKVAALKKVDPSLVVIRKITPKYGIKKAVITAFIYDNVDNLRKIEPKKKGKKVDKDEKKEDDSGPETKSESKPEVKTDDKKEESKENKTE